MPSHSRLFSTWLDLVTLIGTERRIICWTECVTCAWVIPLVALAYHLGVLVVAFAFAQKVGCHLDGSSTNLDGGCIRAGDVLRSEGLTFIQCTLASTIT